MNCLKELPQLKEVFLHRTVLIPGTYPTYNRYGLLDLKQSINQSIKTRLIPEVDQPLGESKGKLVKLELTRQFGSKVNYSSCGW